MARHEEKPKTRAWDAPDQEERQPSLLDRIQLYYTLHPRRVSTAAMAVVLAAAAAGIMAYRTQARHARAMEEAHGLTTILELEPLRTQYADTEALPIILFRLGRAYQDRAQAPGSATAKERLDDLNKAKDLFNTLGTDYPKHPLVVPGEDALKAVIEEITLLSTGHEEHELRHTLLVHPEILDRRAHGPEGHEVDAPLRMSPRAGADPRVRIVAGEAAAVDLILFPEEAPEGAEALLNDARIDKLRDNPFVPEPGGKRYRLSSGPARPGTFTPARNSRVPDLGAVALELGADGKPILDQYVIFNDTEANLSAEKERFHVIGRVSSPLADLQRLKADSRITSSRELTDHESDLLPPGHP